MIDWTFLLLIPTVLAALWLIPHARPHLATSRGVNLFPTNTRNPSTRYHAVSVKPCDGACEAAKALQGRRYLAAEAISLPVPRCDAKVCHCTYQHHEDRRSGYDRRHDSINMDNVTLDGEQRHGRDRRRVQPAF